MGNSEQLAPPPQSAPKRESTLPTQTFSNCIIQGGLSCSSPEVRKAAETGDAKKTMETADRLGKKQEVLQGADNYAKEHNYFGQSRDQFLSGFSSYLKQLGFDIGVDLLKRIIDNKLSAADVQYLQQQALQNYALDAAQRQREQGEKLAEGSKERIEEELKDKVLPGTSRESDTMA